LDNRNFKTVSFWNISFKDSGTPSYFKKVVSEILQQRRKTGPTGRQDLMHLMLTANEDSTETHRSRNNWPVSDLSFRGLRNFDQYFGLHHLPAGPEPECTEQIKRGDQGSSQEKP